MDISVIVPVFNLESYIKKTIDSIKRQRFIGSIEIVIVDDGSTDNTLSIVQSVFETDPQVKIISQKNAGVSAARNVGLSLACGKYILFVDGDDILREDAIEKLVNGLNKHENAIISCGDLKRIASQDDRIPSTNNIAELADSDQIIARILTEQYEVSACAKLYVRDKLDDLRFVEGRKINEDKYFLIQYLIKNQGMVVNLNDYVYGYYVRNGSASNSTFSENSLDMIYFSEQIHKDIIKYKPHMETLARYNNVVTHLAVLKKIVRSGMRHQYMEIYDDARLRLLDLTESHTVKNINIHAWEVNILRYFPLLYGVCVRLFDKMQTMKRWFNAQRIKSNEEN